MSTRAYIGVEVSLGGETFIDYTYLHYGNPMDFLQGSTTYAVYSDIMDLAWEWDFKMRRVFDRREFTNAGNGDWDIEYLYLFTLDGHWICRSYHDRKPKWVRLETLLHALAREWDIPPCEFRFLQHCCSRRPAFDIDLVKKPAGGVQKKHAYIMEDGNGGHGGND